MITSGWTPPGEVVEFEQTDEEPADDQFDKLSVDVEDPGALVHPLGELGD